MVNPTINRPGGDELLSSPPAGKVANVAVDESYARTQSLSNSSMTKIASTSTAVTVAFEDTVVGRGELRVDVNNDVGGVRGPTIDPSNFREVRWGVVIRDNLTANNKLFFGLWDTTGVSAASTDTVGFEQQQSDAAVTLRDEAGSLTSPSPNFDAIQDGNSRYLEFRYRQPENRLQIVSGGGDSLEFDDVDASAFDATGELYPRVYIMTTKNATNESFWLSRSWLTAIHN